MRVGYARVSTLEQDLTAQVQALRLLDVDQVYTDQASGRSALHRPGLNQALAACRAGDEFVVTKVDRLARSLADLTRIIGELHERGVKVILGGVAYDPSDPVGKLLVSVLGMVAEFEADLIRQRTREGMAIARANGRLKGPPRKLNARQEAHLAQLHTAGGHTIADLMDLFGVSRAVVYRTLTRERARLAESTESVGVGPPQSRGHRGPTPHATPAPLKH